MYSGGNTPSERKELYDRVVDGIGAVRSAKKEGILAGGGVALFGLASNVDWAGEIKTQEQSVAMEILTKSIMLPLTAILDNSDLDFETVYAEMKDFTSKDRNTILDGWGYNVVTGKTGNMIEMGVADPALVTKTALTNSVSVAISLLNTNVVITLAQLA